MRLSKGTHEAIDICAFVVGLMVMLWDGAWELFVQVACP